MQQLEDPGGVPIDTPEVPDLPQAPPEVPEEQQLPPGAEDGEVPDEDDPNQPPRRGSMLADLIQERTRRQMAEQTAHQHNELVRSIMQAPGGPELLQRVARGEQNTPQEDTAELEAIAADLGLLNPDGSMDLATAKRIQSRTERQLQRALQPLQQQSLMQQAEGAIQHTLQVARSFGADPAVVERGLRGIPPDQAMNPQVQQATILLAMGLQGLAGGQGPQMPQPPMGQAPLVTEGVRGRSSAGARLDPLWRGRLQGAGLKDTEIDGALRGYDARIPQKLE